MTVAELLKPRYKVIAEWPAGEYLVGDVFTMEPDEDGTLLDPIHFVFDHTCQKYPHLFKKLEWWEERKPEEMPKYVKTKQGKVFEAQEHFFRGGYGCRIGNWVHLTYHDPRNDVAYYECKPATEQEYLNSQPKQSKL